MVIAAKNGNEKATLSLDIGMKQSQRILPAIDDILAQVGLKPADLDYMALCEGPGTFTGLRLAFSALKAIELSCGKPIYGIPSLEAYAFPFRDFGGTVVSVIDAKKDQFFAAAYENGTCVLEAEDTTAEKIAAFLGRRGTKSLVVGPDAALFSEKIREADGALDIISFSSQPNPTDALFTIAENLIEQKKNRSKIMTVPFT